MSVKGFFFINGEKKPIIFTDKSNIKDANFKTIANLDFMLNFEENRPVKLLFIGNPEAKIYIDNSRLGNMEQQKFEWVDGEKRYYFNPQKEYEINSKYFYIFRNSQNHNHSQDIMRNYGPGIFRVKIKEPAQKTVYCYLHILPKFLSADELDLMRGEVEAKVTGMSRYFETIHNGILTSKSSININLNAIEKMEYLKREEAAIRKSIYSILDSPRQQISKRYSWKKSSNGGMDLKSIKVMQMHPKQDDLYTFKRFIDLNLVDNQFIKFNLIELNLIINNLKKRILKAEEDKTSQNSAQIIALKDGKKLLNRYISMVSYALSSEVFSNVENTSLRTKLSNSAMMDVNYRTIYQVVREMRKKDKSKDRWVRQYSYDWLRTAFLYEIWGFIKVLDSLIEKGFEPISGWIFDSDFYENIESNMNLKHGTEVKLKYESEDKKIFFNCLITYNVHLKRDTELGNNKDKVLLWTTSVHNKPDIVVTFLDEEQTLLSAMIFDTKYRSDDVVTGIKYKSGEIREQILAYANDIKSARYLSNEKKDLGFNNKTPVDKVIVLHPKSNINSERDFINGDINSIELRTDVGEDLLTNKISEVINRATKRYLWMKK